MKYIVTSVTTALLVAVVCIPGLRFAQETREPHAVSPESRDLLAEVRANSEAIASLHSEMRTVRGLLSEKHGISTGKTDAPRHIESKALIDRIEKLEDAIEVQSEYETVLGKKDSTGLQKQFAERVSQLAVVSASSQSDLRESDFENDSGIPLGEYASSINETLHAVENIEISGMDCRDSICKVTYSRLESEEFQEEYEGGYELVDKLALASGGRGVRIRYAKDPSGNDVMYIQLQ